MPTAALITLGCKVNQYDTQAMQEVMLRNGYTVVGENDPADVCIINTCTVTNAADQKARQVIRRAIRKNPDTEVLVTGCYAESDREAIEAIPGVSLVFGNREKADLQKYLDLVHESWREKEKDRSPLLQIWSCPSRCRPRTRKFQHVGERSGQTHTRAH